MNEKALQQQRNLGQNLESLLNHPGWKHLEEFLIQKYLKAFNQLKTSDSPQARATLQVIEDLFAELEVKIDWAKVAIRKLKKEE